MTAAAESPFRRLLRTSTRYRSVCWRASIFSVLNKIFDIAPEVLIGVAVDIVVTREQSFLARFGLTDGKDQLYALALMTLAIWVCESLFEYLFSLDWRRLAQTVQHDLRIEAYQHVQNLDVAFFEERSAGGLVSILNDDINQLERFLDGGANALLQVMTSVLVIGGIFFYLAPQVAVWAMLPIPVILIGAFYYQRRAEPLYAEVRAKAALLGGKLAANLAGITTIKAQTAEDHEVRAIRRESEAYLRSNGRAIAVSSAFIPLIRMAVLSGFIATLILGGHMAWNGELAVGSYGVLVFLTQRLLWPLTSLAQTVDLYQRAAASTTRILDLLATPIVSPQGSLKPNKPSVRGALAFDRVSFAYSGRDALFDGLTLSMPAGSKTAIVGATGSGKSTIAKLLLRFYEPTGGKITLDGAALHDIDAVSLRHLIGFVGQDLYLFDGTVRENIAYGNFGATDAEIKEAARVADAHEFIDRLPNGYDTIVGERGTKLSGGQRQRIAIARAVLKDPPILLLDEATSAVDNESERLIQRALERVAVGRTTLMIAHRLSTVMNCDTIHVVDRGKIVETGTHAELIAKKGAYARLWAAQAGL